MGKRFFFWVVLATLAFYALSSPAGTQPTGPVADIVVATSDTEYGQGSLVELTIQNNTDQDATLPNDCPAEPFQVEMYSASGKWEAQTATAEIPCNEEKTFTVPAKSSVTLSYGSWNYALFGELGRYRVLVPATLGETTSTFESNNFSVVEPSFITTVFRNLLYRPFYNLMIGLAKYLPGHSLGLAIIIMTILIRIALLVPSQKALKSQKKMQSIQPKIEEIKKKYGNDQQKVAQETMKLWREANVSPLGSCLPLLIQFPILIALFYVVKEGLDPNNIHLLYGPLKDFDIKLIDPTFLGVLDLTKIDPFALPLVVGILQFSQMKLALPKQKKKTKEEKKNAGPDMAQMSTTMMYVMPVMIAVFTASLPSGVGMYWAVSTIFGIGQQFVVNKGGGKSGTHEPKNPDGVTIRVIK